MDTKKESFINGYLKVTKILYYITKYATFFFYLGTVLLAIIIFSTFFNDIGEKTILSFNQLGIDKSKYSTFNYKLIIFSLSSQFLFYGILNSLFLKHINQILRNVMNHKPFIYKNGMSIRKMGWFLVAQSIIGYIYSFIGDLFFLKVPVSFDIFYSEAPLLLFGVCLLILSGVFHYGCYLQEEYDSML